jgi:hypothetical protein
MSFVATVWRLYDRDRAISTLLALLTFGRCGRGTKVQLRGLSQWRP